MPTVVELRAELVSRSLDPQGKKDVLLARLKAAVDAEQAVPAVVAPIEELLVEPVPTLFKPRLTPAPAAEPTVEAAPAEEGLKRKASGTDDTPKHKPFRPVPPPSASPADSPAVVAVEPPAAPPASTPATPQLDVVMETAAAVSAPLPPAPKSNPPAPTAVLPSPTTAAAPAVPSPFKVAVVPTPSSSTPPPSASLYISGLVRPFTLPQLREKLASYGEVTYFWIDAVKTHCYCTFDHVASAVAARAGLDDAVWPEASGKALSVTFLPDARIPALVVQEEEAKKARTERLELFVRYEGEWFYDLRPLRLATSGAGGVGKGLSNSRLDKVPSADPSIRNRSAAPALRAVARPTPPPAGTRHLQSQKPDLILTPTASQSALASTSTSVDTSTKFAPALPRKDPPAPRQIDMARFYNKTTCAPPLYWVERGGKAAPAQTTIGEAGDNAGAAPLAGPSTGESSHESRAAQAGTPSLEEGGTPPPPNVAALT